MTDGDKIHDNPKCDRDVTLYGYVRGTYLKPNGTPHVPLCRPQRPIPNPHPSLLQARSTCLVSVITTCGA